MCAFVTGVQTCALPIFAAYVEAVLAAHEREAFAQFEEQVLDPLDQRLLQVPFVGASSQIDEIQHVRILEQLDRGGCPNWVHRGREIGNCLAPPIISSETGSGGKE